MNTSERKLLLVVFLATISTGSVSATTDVNCTALLNLSREDIINAQEYASKLNYSMHALFSKNTSVHVTELFAKRLNSKYYDKILNELQECTADITERCCKLLKTELKKLVKLVNGYQIDLKSSDLDQSFIAKINDAWNYLKSVIEELLVNFKGCCTCEVQNEQ